MSAPLAHRIIRVACGVAVAFESGYLPHSTYGPSNAQSAATVSSSPTPFSTTSAATSASPATPAAIAPTPATRWLSFWHIATLTYPPAITSPRLRQPPPLKNLSCHHPALYERQLRGLTVFTCRRCGRTFRSSRQLSAHHRGGGGPPGGGSARRGTPRCDAKSKMRHMNVKHPPGCPLPPPLLFSAEEEEWEEEEEEVVMAVQVKEEDEEQRHQLRSRLAPLQTIPRHSADLNPASPQRGGGEEGVVKAQMKPDAGDEAVKEERKEGACECALCGKGFEQLLAIAGQTTPAAGAGTTRPPPGPGATPAGTAASSVAARRRCSGTKDCTRWRGPTTARGPSCYVDFKNKREKC
ncbi:hypothetical protein SKAU_G00417450 [Synaphobranchus kaupii]|uniref:C2H2-type domain-containing protein n=1 Tax=Synaphobranchus kaupii TaxID=118154 RepID=A0A9Q1IAU2_SYNKA|nr:hypothetical protein SKAU_G00417450 [Synaphobranchus kaupii]